MSFSAGFTKTSSSVKALERIMGSYMKKPSERAAKFMESSQFKSLPKTQQNKFVRGLESYHSKFTKARNLMSKYEEMGAHTLPKRKELARRMAHMSQNVFTLPKTTPKSAVPKVGKHVPKIGKYLAGAGALGAIGLGFGAWLKHKKAQKPAENVVPPVQHTELQQQIAPTYLRKDPAYALLD